MSNYRGTENKGNPIILAKDPISSAVSSITFDGVFDDKFSEYWVTLFNITMSTASGVQILFKWRNSGSDITGTYYRNYRAISMQVILIIMPLLIMIWELTVQGKH